MPGATDVAAILRSMAVERRLVEYAYVSIGDPAPELRASAAAVVEEAEGTTLVLPLEAARAAGLDPLFTAVWLTLAVHSSLDAVGLTAAVSTALAEAGIPCNVIAGAYHDHLLVPISRATDAVAALTRLTELSA